MELLRGGDGSLRECLDGRGNFFVPQKLAKGKDMGFGDPYHKHPLRSFSYRPPFTNCFYCDLPFNTLSLCYGCQDCDYYIHIWCQDLPTKLRVPLHDQHLLTLFKSPPNFSSSSNSPNILCNECQNSCLGRFSYQCTTCQFFFHLECLFTLDHEKHQHCLIFADSVSVEYERFKYCKICGSYIYGFVFGCDRCKFYIHQECSLIPLEIKHRHVHKLTLKHYFPEECDQVYCDLCEDRDGEMDPGQSYYYCKDCDYIAHVNCCITQTSEDVFFLCERFTHEHPLRLPKNQIERVVNTNECLLSCTQCSYTVSKDTSEYPSLVKHPYHPHHTILFDSEHMSFFNCTECNFSMHINEFNKFKHPLWRRSLEFICKNGLYRCDACGELGKGSRITSNDGGRFDIHLECFALPGKLEHESHPNHPLYIRWLDESTSRCCSICRKEMDPQLWFYICQECDYVAHMDCVACGLLSILRSSIKNEPDFCAIIEPSKSSFKYRIEDMRPSVPSYSRNFPVLEVDSVFDKLSEEDCFNDEDGDDDDDDDDEYDSNDNDEDDDDDDDEYNNDDDGDEYDNNDNNENDHNDDEGNCDLGIETIAYGLGCPKCNSLIATQAGYSTLKDWKLSFLRNRIETANNQTPSGSEPLTFLDEHIVDELCCSICNMLIFPPTYLCASCQTYFHKSCVELPHRILFNETTYVLTPPPFPESLSNCTNCNYPVSSFAYLSAAGGFIFDVQCAAGAPLVNPTYHNHVLEFLRASELSMWMNLVKCKACENVMQEKGDILMKCLDCPDFLLHPECGLLPGVIKHRIHWHPLELATDLAELYDEHVCDVCEKDLNPNLWAYRCVDECGIRATSHVSCVITSKKKCHFNYDKECQNMTEEQKLEFRRKAKERGIKL